MHGTDALCQMKAGTQWFCFSGKFITFLQNFKSEALLCMWSWCWCAGKLVNGALDLWLQVWHQPRERYPVWAEHRDSSHRRPGLTLRVCGRGSALSTNFRHESGLSRHKENVLLRCFPQVSFQQSAPVLTSDLFTISISSSILFISGYFHTL